MPEDVVRLIDKEAFQTRLRLSMAVNEDILLMPLNDRDGFIGKGDLIGWASPDAPHLYNGYHWNEHVSWLTIYFWYNAQPDGNCGSTWVADGQFLYLGSVAPLDEESRRQFLAKLGIRQSDS